MSHEAKGEQILYSVYSEDTADILKSLVTVEIPHCRKTKIALSKCRLENIYTEFREVATEENSYRNKG